MKPLTIRELTKLQELHKVMFVEQIAELLNRPVLFIKNAAKKYNVPVQTIPRRLGTIKTKMMYGRKTLFLVSKKRSTGLATYMYQAFSGAPLPRGHKVKFKDGNPLNCRFDNLELYNLAAYGEASRFKEGQIPFNKGTKGVMKPNKTTFKKGLIPSNTKEDGFISVRCKEGEKPYKFIRLEKSKWVLLHRFIWEQANGPIPPGHIVTFIDGDSMNCELSNLRLVSRSEQVLENQNRAKAAESIKHRYRIKKAIAKHRAEFPALFQ